MMHPLHLDIPADTAFLASLRGMTSAWLRSVACFESDWPLIVTELATNAIEASPESGSVTIDLALVRRPDPDLTTEPTGFILLTVVDDGPGFELSAARRQRHHGHGGRGLRIVETLTTSLTATRVAGRHSVICHAPAIRLVSDTSAGTEAGDRTELGDHVRV